MKLLWKNCKGYYPQLILGPIFKLMEAIFELMVPLLMANIIDIGLKQQNRDYVIQQGWLLFVLAVLGIVTSLICQYFASVAAFGFGASLRKQVFSHILDLSSKETDAVGTSGLITRITNDVNLAQNGVNMFIRLATRVPFLLIGSIVMAFQIHAGVALVFLVTTPLIMASLYWIMKRTLPDYIRIQQKQDELGALAGETMTGARVIRAFSHQKQEQRQFATAAQKLTDITVAAGRWSGALNPITYLIANLGIMVILWAGAKLTNQGILLSGDVFALVNYLNQSLLALITMANLIVQFTRAISSMRRLEQLLDTPSSIQSGSQPVPAQGIASPLLALSHLGFSYTKNRPVLQDLNLTVPTGQTIGIIGGTGCGKSTLAKLLVRFYDATEGEILFAGTDLRQLSLPEVRKQIGYVPQNVNLFSGTIRSNLTLARPDATDDELWEALRIAQAEEFVLQKPLALDTPVEEGGKNFSGGQRQRLTIARALVGRPSLLILDDSSSALDYATDAALRHSLRTALAGTTVILISQRAATLQQADQIMVLDGGKMAGLGTHKELLEQCPVYQEICLSQKLISTLPTHEKEVQV